MKRVLIIKMSALGDVFMAMPQVEAILAHHAQDSVTILTGPAFRDIFIHHPRLRVVTIDRSGWFGPEGAWARTLWVWKQRFPVVYDLQGNRTSRRLVAASMAPKRVGTQPRWMYTHHPKARYTRKTQVHVFDRLNETLASAGLPPARPGAELHAGESDAAFVLQWKKKYRIVEGNYVLLHAGSSAGWPSKRWPEAHFAALAGMLENCGLTCVWIGGAEDSDLNRRLSGTGGIDATQVFSLMQLYLLGRGAKAAVTNDSGPMHVLGITGIPVFAFFGPTSWHRSHAPGQQDRVIRNDVACSPCFLGGCPPGRKHACMARILPETVFGRICEALGIN